MSVHDLHESPNVLKDGAWETRGLIRVWVPSNLEPADSVCPVCWTTAAEPCKTASGMTATPHQARRTPQTCRCGAPRAKHKNLCEDCRVEGFRRRWRRCSSRRRTAA